MTNLSATQNTQQAALYAAFASGILAADGVVPARPDDQKGQDKWREDVRILLDDLESLIAVRMLSEEALSILSDPDFEKAANKKRIITGRVVAVSTLGADISILALQTGWGKKIGLEEAQKLWAENYKDSDAHKRDEGLLRAEYGIERFFLPDATSTLGAAVLRKAKISIGKHVRVWKEVQQFEGKNKELRDKRVAVHIDELPTEFTFRQRTIKSKAGITNTPKASTSGSARRGVSVEEWEDFYMDIEADYPDVDIDALVSACANKIGRNESEWTDRDRARAQHTIKKSVVQTTKT